MAFGHSSKRITIEISILVLIGAALILSVERGVRWGATHLLPAIPLSIDTRLGELGSEAMQLQPVCTNQALQEAVRTLAAQLADPKRVTVLDSPEVNAAALPGGYLFVNSALLAEAQTVDEVAGVIGHELGHAHLRHGVEALIRNASWAVAFDLLFGNFDALTGAVAANTESLLSIQYSRTHELEADAYGIKLVSEAGLDRSGLARFFAHMPNVPTAMKLLSSHPPSEERRAALAPIAATQAQGAKRVTVSIAQLHAPCAAREAVREEGRLE